MYKKLIILLVLFTLIAAGCTEKDSTTISTSDGDADTNVSVPDDSESDGDADTNVSVPDDSETDGDADTNVSVPDDSEHE